MAVIACCAGRKAPAQHRNAGLVRTGGRFKREGWCNVEVAW